VVEAAASCMKDAVRDVEVAFELVDALLPSITTSISASSFLSEALPRRPDDLEGPRAMALISMLGFSIKTVF